MKKLIIFLSATMFLAACGSESETDAPDEAELAQEASEQTQPRREVRRAPAEPEAIPLQRRNGDPARDIPVIEGQSESPGYGLTLPVDGSSPQAFQESLELIAMDTSSEQYREFDAALRYLGRYAPEAWDGLPSLYQGLDGLSGEDIIAMATELRTNRTRRPTQ